VLTEIYSEDYDPALSADMIHHLLTHPDDVVAMAMIKDPIAAAREVAKLSLIASSAHSGPAAQSPAVTRAKPLIKPVKSAPAAPAAKSIDDLPFSSLVKAVAKQEREFRELRRGG
jgi:hypothetical protein